MSLKFVVALSLSLSMSTVLLTILSLGLNLWPLSPLFCDTQVIFDEAHNIESTCEGASSFELSGLELAGMMAETDKVCL